MENQLKQYGIKVGLRLIMFRSGFANSGKDGYVCIGIVDNIDLKENSILIRQYGYDISEENYIQGFFTKGYYSLEQTIDIVNAQNLLQGQFRNVIISKNPIDFYQSEKNLAELNP